MLESSQEWSREVFRDCQLGDRRREERLIQVAQSLAMHTGRSLNASTGESQASNEGAYRFIDNVNVDPDAIGQGGFRSSWRRAQGSRVLLAVEDSTTLAYQHSARLQLGDLGGPANAFARGFWVHSSLLVDGDTERTVGLIGQHWRIRPVEERGRKKKDRPFREKESFKWEEMSEELAGRLGPELARVISVCDREADVYEYIGYKLAQEQRFIVRASQPRVVAGTGRDIWQEASQWEALGTRELEVPQRGGLQGRQRRTARLTIRAGRVTLRAPTRKGQLKSVELHLVYAHEEAPPEGVEALDWLLFTSEEARTLEQACRVVRYYRLRWRIEDFHKAWKSGCGVEELRMQSRENLKRMAIILAFVAVRLLQLREVGRTDPEESCEPMLAPEEWQCLWMTAEQSPVPASPPSKGWVLSTLAKLGGWRPNKRYQPGWPTLWQGWFRFQERLLAWRAFKKFRSDTM